MRKLQAGQTLKLRDLANEVSDRLELPRDTTYECLTTFFLALRETLEQNCNVSIRGFGAFDSKAVDAQRVYLAELRRYALKPAYRTIGFKTNLKFD